MNAMFDPLGHDFLSNPYPHFTAQRDGTPVAYCEDINMWVVTKYEDVEHVFMHPELFSASIAQDPLLPMCDEARQILQAGVNITPVMSNADAPHHTRVRRRLAKAFSKKRMVALEADIANRCASLIAAFGERDHIELMQEICYPLPALTLFTMIGFPLDDADQIKKWSYGKLAVNWGRPSTEEQVNSAKSMVEYWKYCEAFVQRRRSEKADDLTSDLMMDEDMSEPFTDQEMASIIFGLSFAGHETTTNLAGNCLRAIIENDLWRWLRSNRERLPDVVEETLRYDSSVLMWRRRARCETEVGGIRIPEGSKLLLALGSANHDPSRFPDGEKFEPGRENANRHLSFGKGVHHCLGAHLARIEVGVIVGQLLDRYANAALASQEPLAFSRNVAFRGPTMLPVKVHRA